MGDKTSKEFANTTTIENFVLTIVNKELQDMLPSFDVSKSGSHIWIEEKTSKTRVMLITF